MVLPEPPGPTSRTIAQHSSGYARKRGLLPPCRAAFTNSPMEFPSRINAYSEVAMASLRIPLKCGSLGAEQRWSRL